MVSGGGERRRREPAPTVQRSLALALPEHLFSTDQQERSSAVRVPRRQAPLPGL